MSDQRERLRLLRPCLQDQVDSGKLLNSFDAMITMLEEEADALASTEAKKANKTEVESAGEIAVLISHFRYARNLLMLRMKTSILPFALNPQIVSEEVHQFFCLPRPIGVVALILPYNFPAVVLAERLPYILAAGNAAAVKPSEIATGAVPEIVALAQRAFGIDKVQCFFGEAEVGRALVDSQYINMVSFTGSTVVGRSVAERCGFLLKPCSLELGGNNLAVVDASADIELALEHCCRGITYHSGQCCISTRRIFVPRGSIDDFVSRLTERLKLIVATGDVLPLTAPSISCRDIIAEFESKGRVIVIENHSGPDVCIFMPCSTIKDEEIFGPVVSIREYDEGGLVELLNDSSFGLALQIFSTRDDFIKRVVESAKAGRIWVNSSLKSDPCQRIGGYGDSGNSWIGGDLALHDYSSYKALTVGSFS